MATDLAVPDATVKRTSLIIRFASKYGIEQGRMLETLKQTCFRTERPITNEQMAALLLVCEANDLNPFVRMVHALLDKGGNVVPFIGFDGWIALVNRHPMMRGYQIVEAADGASATCRMWRADWLQPGEITTYLSEVKRGSTPWSTSPRQMLQVRSYVRCARITFGFPGLHDEYDARVIARGDAEPEPPVPPPNTTSKRIRETLDQPPPDIDPWHDDDEPKTLEQWVREVTDAPTQEDAALKTEETRNLPFHAEVAAAYRARWFPTDKE